ncbi:MAG: IclR family transcriptional regulator [Rhodospirillum sp.]|nr:IclR family transcriptional regulator [Rhodospirillum sp.]MCF8491520.1 IclR family transcriptional regulator [Rhodospirillum sp.]MCF8502151.1 IclR family transcriptional regulator [Rhodospirillum sp.]
MNGTASTNSAISRSILLLEAISRYLRPVGVQELALELDQPRQSVHRLVAQLEALGLVLREPGSDRFSVGPRLRTLSLSCISSYQQTSTTHQILINLVKEVGETCNVGMLDGNEILYIDRVECDWPLRVQLKPGSRVPVYCTAIGKLMLAFSETRHRRKVIEAIDLVQLTDSTITDPILLDLEFDEIQARNFAVNREEDALGLIAVAVAIRDPAGEVIAGLGMHAPTARMSIDRAKGCLPKLRAAAAEMSQAMFK